MCPCIFFTFYDFYIQIIHKIICSRPLEVFGVEIKLIFLVFYDLNEPDIKSKRDA